MKDIEQLSRYLGNFLYSYRIENWMGVNPEHRELNAGSRQGLLSLIRIAVPACKGFREARLCEALRLAQYKIIEDDDGFYVERDTAPMAAIG